MYEWIGGNICVIIYEKIKHIYYARSRVVSM